MATIYDIAKLSETSAATVSYVLNGRGNEKRISRPTQERILGVAERLNYRPNIMARQLKSASSAGLRIAAFWPDFYFEQPMVSAMRAINNVSHMSLENIEVSVHFFTPDRLEEVWDRLSPAGYNGVLLAGASLKDLDHIAGRPCAVPIVLVNRHYEGIPSVSIDHAEAGRMACDLAFERGGDSICTVWDTRFHVATNLRRRAFTARAEELGLDLTGGQFTCEGSSDDGYELGVSMVQKKQLRRVLYCNNESIARGLSAAFNESGIKLGKELLFFTANNGPDSFCRYMTPPLTVINLRIREVVENALKLCISLISRVGDEKASITLQPYVKFRESMPEADKQ